MLRLPTTLLRHETCHDTHHDWLMADPRTAWQHHAPLWTARLTPPSRHWSLLGAWQLQPIRPHRAHYLTYQGPLAPQDGRSRGQVRRIDRGTFVPHLWTDHRIVIDLAMHHFRGRVEIRRVTDDRYTATSTPIAGRV